MADARFTQTSQVTTQEKMKTIPQQPVVCPRCGGTKTGTKDTGFSMCFECGVFWGWRSAADDSEKAPVADKTAFDSSALFGAEAEHERAENRVRQAVEAAEKAPNE